ncbi:MAG: sarcosine oxidase subunit gamma [Candidatus Pelagibacter sp.]|mgnify:CR=1 FL=1|jgi:sarcosine oxidase subunit gamma|nr:sarcosine oxidase subunit gamma [Candidatus Pelagibacter sp.]MBT3693605.1 sarcosine oxidase subunit gamma [Candidatus Pelagibacter sp.]MDA8569573.1 sarcosine oxidase subunit gamma [Candidatus Pelagibacter bacterium]MDB2526874.1 sarcosine oxidase subunit gamma [Candidatus Pelagibacter bacterium]MDC0448649.1 sarcosine oxidase subunit gamma [Candidatus Pelagibacter sp.]|tara:strand:+ start:259 stop:822 length:564 start_codon:yes stop_codon:yes gene_type:complete
MLNYKSSIIEDKKYSGLSIKEISPIMKLNLRGKSRDFLSTIGKNINMILPIEANTSSSSDKYTSMWLSPDEWMIISNNIIDKENNNYEIEELLFNKISKTNLGSVTDVSDQFVLINLEGESVFDILSSGCAFNFNEFMQKKGAVTQTLLAQVDIIIHHKEINNINLFVRRSFSEHLMSWINDAASRL